VLKLAEPGAFLTIGTFLHRDRLSAPAIRAFTALLSEDRHAIAVTALPASDPRADVSASLSR
jgi:hypothetical protein